LFNISVKIFNTWVPLFLLSSSLFLSHLNPNNEKISRENIISNILSFGSVKVDARAGGGKTTTPTKPATPSKTTPTPAKPTNTNTPKATPSNEAPKTTTPTNKNPTQNPTNTQPANNNTPDQNTNQTNPTNPTKNNNVFIPIIIPIGNNNQQNNQTNSDSNPNQPPKPNPEDCKTYPEEERPDCEKDKEKRADEKRIADAKRDAENKANMEAFGNFLKSSAPVVTVLAGLGGAAYWANKSREKNLAKLKELEKANDPFFSAEKLPNSEKSMAEIVEGLSLKHSFYFVNKKASNYKEDDGQSWKVDLEGKHTEVEVNWGKVFGKKVTEEIVKTYVKSVFESYQNDWMEFELNDVKKYVTPEYDYELTNIYAEQNVKKGFRERDVVIDHTIKSLKAVYFEPGDLDDENKENDQNLLIMQINSRMINVKILEGNNDNPDQGKITKGSRKYQECTEYLVFKIDKKATENRVKLHKVFQPGDKFILPNGGVFDC